MDYTCELHWFCVFGIRLSGKRSGYEYPQKLRNDVHEKWNAVWLWPKLRMKHNGRHHLCTEMQPPIPHYACHWQPPPSMQRQWWEDGGQRAPTIPDATPTLVVTHSLLSLLPPVGPSALCTKAHNAVAFNAMQCTWCARCTQMHTNAHKHTHCNRFQWTTAIGTRNYPPTKF